MDGSALSRMGDVKWDMYRRWLVVWPATLQDDIISELQGSRLTRHQGVKKTLSKIRHHYFWARITADVCLKVRKCSVCTEGNHSVLKHQRFRLNSFMQKYQWGEIQWTIHWRRAETARREHLHVQLVTTGITTCAIPTENMQKRDLCTWKVCAPGRDSKNKVSKQYPRAARSYPHPWKDPSFLRWTRPSFLWWTRPTLINTPPADSDEHAPASSDEHVIPASSDKHARASSDEHALASSDEHAPADTDEHAPADSDKHVTPASSDEHAPASSDEHTPASSDKHTRLHPMDTPQLLQVNTPQLSQMNTPPADPNEDTPTSFPPSPNDATQLTTRKMGQLPRMIPLVDLANWGRTARIPSR